MIGMFKIEIVEVKLMKRVVTFIISICLLLSMVGCVKEKTSIKDYQYMYKGIVFEWNKAATPGHYRSDLFGFGEYLYNSYLMLFPRETPSTLKEYYFHWSPLMDVDGYAIYFTCQLSEENYSSFVDGLDNFKLYNGETTIEPLYDDTHFSLPTYILQWSDVGEKWEVIEYIMMDKKTNTIAFVYTMGELELIEENSSYSVTPSELNFLSEDFSIYQDFENSKFDISFLRYLK